MSIALAVHHGRFGRVTLYRLNRAMAVHAHREVPLERRMGAAVSPWPGKVE